MIELVLGEIQGITYVIYWIMQLKASAEKKANGENPHDEKAQYTSENVLDDEDKNHEYFEETGDIESYIDEVSEHMERGMGVRDHTSARIPTTQGAKVLDNAPLPEVSDNFLLAA